MHPLPNQKLESTTTTQPVSSNNNGGGGGPECSNQFQSGSAPEHTASLSFTFIIFLYAWGYSSDDRSLPRKPSTAYTLPVNCGCSICSGLVLRLISVSFGGLMSGLCLQLGLLNWPFYLSNGSANASRNFLNYCHCLDIVNSYFAPF